MTAMPPHPPAQRPMWRYRLDADAILHACALGAALIVFAMFIALIVVLVHGAMPSIRTFGFGFLTESSWRSQPTYVKDPLTHAYLLDAAHRLPGETYGALAVIYGTAVTSMIALLLAVPPSFAAAIFLVRLAPRWLAQPVSFLVEFLAAIPSLAYGLWGMLVLCPLLGDHIEPAIGSLLARIPMLSGLVLDDNHRMIQMTGRDVLAGGLILTIMIVPIITAVSRDVLRGVPWAQVEGSVALGATWWQSCVEMLKYSRRGLFGAVTLGLARAAGETMAVTMVIGIDTKIHLSPFAPAQTMSSLLAVNFGGVAAGLERSSLVEVAMVLLIMSLLFNLVARYLVVGKTTRAAGA